mgnify:CR=1 FL=1
MNFENSAIGYIINYATPNSTWGGETPDMSEYFEVGKQICEKWNIPYIDLFSGTVEVDGETLSYSYDILDVMTGDNMYKDDAGEVHIGGSGYDLIAPYIAAWVETLEDNETPEGLIAEINDFRGKIVKLFGKLENYVFSLYTEETLEILDLAVSNAETVIADENATDEEEKAAYELLVKAVDSLKVGENIALGKPVSASHNDANAYKVTDGSLSTYWESVDSDDVAIADSSFVIDLQGIYDVDAITAVPYYASNSRIYHYDILVSTDNETWTKVAEQRTTEYTKEEGATFELEETVEARYIKVEGVYMHVVERPTLINFHVVEMRAYGTLLEEVEIEETKDDVFVTENEVENPFEALLHSNEEDDVVEEENPFDALLHSDEEEDIEEENPFEVPLHSNEEDDVEGGNPFDALLHSDEEENIEEEIDDEDEEPFIMIEEEEEEEEEEQEQEEKEEPVQEEDDDDKQDSGIRAYKKINNEYFTLGDILEQAEDNSLAARLQKKPVTDLTTAIGINDKFLLLNELFSGSMEKYNKSIRALNNFSTYLGAKTYMSELQIEFQWDCDSEAYKKLDNLVERRFL